MVFCPTRKKMVDKGTEINPNDDRPRGPMVIGPLEPFVSPVTGETISSREQLRRHNRAHGVTNSQDYSPEFLARRAKERHREATGDTPQAAAERRALIMRAMHRRD